MNPESIALAYNDLAQGGSSDKVYHATLEPTTLDGNQGWKVTIQYGRRGAALMSQTKLAGAPYEQAKKLYDKIVREKKAKGYRVEGEAPPPQVAPSGTAVADIKPPELLEEIINGAHLQYVNDPAYWMQDKSDGVSRGVVKAGGEIFGINKRGIPVPLPAELVEELRAIQLEAFQIDAELVGNRLVCRDLLVTEVDISANPYWQRFASLTAIIKPSFKLVSVVPTWTTAAEKAAAIERSRAERREGVVFKLTSAPYRAGRNGQHKKYKFIKTLSAIAGPPKANGKESVELFLNREIWKQTCGCGQKFDGPLNMPCPGCQTIREGVTHGDPTTERIRCGTVSLIGKPKVQEGDVVEVSYLYAMPGGLMQQARLLSVRTDVDQSECTTAQLIFKREESDADNA